MSIFILWISLEGWITASLNEYIGILAREISIGV